jgi:hypothetical protein
MKIIDAIAADDRLYYPATAVLLVVMFGFIL